MQQRSRWDSYGVTPPSGAAKYEAGKQPIAEYDNWFNKAVVDDIADLNTELTQHKTASVLDHPNNSVTTAKIADGAVTTAKIANSAVTDVKIADGAVTNAKIANNAVTTAKIADGNITTAKIADGAVTTAKIANSAVTDVKIADGAVTNAKIANNAVTTAKIADGNITTAKIADGAVTDAKISGRLSLSKLPTSSTANRVLAVRTANADPVYDKVRYRDIQIDSIPAIYINNTRYPLLSSCFYAPIHWCDLLMWQQPKVEKYINGEWQEVSNSDYLRLFSGAGIGETQVIIPNGSEDLRFTFSIGSFNGGCFLCIYAHTGSYLNSIKITVERSYDGTTWTTLFQDYDVRQDNVAGNAEHALFIVAISLGDASYFRLTLRWVWNTSNNMRIHRIALISYGNDSYTPRKVYAFGWDHDGYLIPRHNATNIGFATHLMPKTDNTYDIGSDTLRWRRIRAVTVSTGDIELANDWRISELDDGVVIKNKDGEEVFRITNDGLWFKGNKIA